MRPYSLKLVSPQQHHEPLVDSGENKELDHGALDAMYICTHLGVHGDIFTYAHAHIRQKCAQT